MNFPFFLLVPALKLVGGIVQSLTQSRPADAPVSIVGGGSPSVEFQPMLQQIIGAQMIAQGATQAPTPLDSPAEGESVSPSTSGLAPYSTLHVPHSALRTPQSTFVPAPADARVAPVVEVGSMVSGVADPQGEIGSQPVHPSFAGAAAGLQSQPDPFAPSSALIAQHRAFASLQAGRPGDAPPVEITGPLSSAVDPLSLYEARFFVEPIDPAARAARNGTAEIGGPGEDGRVGHLTPAAWQEPFALKPDGIANPGLSLSAAHAAPTDVSAPAATQPAVELPRLVDQLASSVRVNWESGRSEARLSLVPPDLGTVRVQMVMEHSSLSLTFTAGSEHARGLIQSSLSELRENLTGQGIDVGQMSVLVDLAGRNSERSFSAFDLNDGRPEAPPRAPVVQPVLAERLAPALSGLDLFA
jgi:hypothetical protein